VISFYAAKESEEGRRGERGGESRTGKEKITEKNDLVHFSDGARGYASKHYLETPF